MEKSKDDNGGTRVIPPKEWAREQRALLMALQSVLEGDFSVRLPGDWIGISGKIADAFNEVVSSNARLAAELERVGQSVGKEGRTGQRVALDRRRGSWGGMQDSVNALVDDLLWPTA